MTTGNVKIDHYVEVMCEHGCRAVYGYIELLKAGQELPECANLDTQERILLRKELEAVMAVFSDNNKS